ncbi:hypothetical protein DM01DRAFT_1347435 [Hesseltinella vesiculosa]|uniref:Uncharacterized protein n=1 Tax=Hesseltinella vesiculosa TaxID=101127 RepID=A0A1X2GCG9_9FUNG|nr:hypothetical protein DM01DRAFT_1347435 [Hesseltinella vesiculosa]
MTLQGAQLSPFTLPVQAQASIDNNFQTTSDSSDSYTPEWSVIGSPDPEDHLFHQNIDISTKFYEFQQEAIKSAKNKSLTVEHNVHEILALSSILLLERDKTDKKLRQFIDHDICTSLRKSILTYNDILGHAFPSSIKQLLEETVRSTVAADATPCLAASLRIMQLMDDHSMTPMNRIILSVRNMVELLPRAVTEEGPREVEWITRTLQGMLGTMLENLEEEVMFRWTKGNVFREFSEPPRSFQETGDAKCL